MPKPGPRPRPYECTRRAWHSERHKPMRGSIIQQVFRFVNDTHSSRTKKNIEWQEKLPVVVLKAEEIMYSKARTEAEYSMYSKARTEAEYMDLETLWDRVNDAVDTIIRKDPSNETDGLLQPCIEAALNLGSIPVRASRSQRNINPRTYLTATTQDSTSKCPRILSNTGNEHVIQNHIRNTHRSFPFLYENLPPKKKQSVAMELESRTPLKLGSVYPLYYGTTRYQSQESTPIFQASLHERTSNIFIGRPIGISVSEPAKKGVLHNLFASENADCTMSIITRENRRDTDNKTLDTECDLSLHLGLSLSSRHVYDEQEKQNQGKQSINVGSSDMNPEEICVFLKNTDLEKEAENMIRRLSG